jgi:hypothetical protein
MAAGRCFLELERSSLFNHVLILFLVFVVVIYTFNVFGKMDKRGVKIKWLVIRGRKFKFGVTTIQSNP